MKRFTLLFILCAAIAFLASASERMTGVNNIKFGWKSARCIEAIGDVPRKMTKEDGLEKQFSYAPATWGRIEWDNSVLNFYRDKLYQVGFYKKSATDDPTIVEQTKVILSAAYGKPVQLKGSDSWMWRASNGNMAILQQTVTTEENGAKAYNTYLIFVDNKEVEKKAKNVDKEMRDIMGIK